MTALLKNLRRRWRRFVETNRQAQRLLSVPFFHRLYHSHAFRVTLGLYGGTLLSVVYAVFNLVTALLYNAVWLGAVAVYYSLLTINRLHLIHGYRQTEKEEGGRAKTHALHFCRASGVFLFALSLAMAVMMAGSVYQNKSYPYTGAVLLVYAVYAISSVITAAVHTVRLRRDGNPILSAAKAVSLASALLAVFNLLSAFLASRPALSLLRRPLNTALGGGAVLTVLLLSLYMIFNARSALKNQARI